MNKSIRLKLRKRNHIHRKAKLTNCPNHWRHYRELRNEIISMVRNAKEFHKQKLTSQILNKDIPSGRWWRITYISKLSNTHKPVTPPPLLRSHGQILLHPLEKAEALNNFYSSSVSEDKTLPEHRSGPLYGEYIYCRTERVRPVEKFKC